MTTARVAILGEALFDLFPDGEVIGGAPFNVARNLAILGADPLMITRIGTDRLGDQIMAEFARFELDTHGVQRDAARATGIVNVHMQGTQHRFEIVEDKAWDALDRSAAVEAALSASPGIVYFGTLAQRSPTSRDAIRAAIDACSAADGSAAIRFLDLNLRDGPDNRTLSAESLALADMVKVNDDELDQLISWFIRPGEPVSAWGEPAQRASIDALMNMFDLRRLVITRGAEGWACQDAATTAWLEGKVPEVEVRDTVGAGDAFASILLLGELRGWPLQSTLQRAAAFASNVCGIQGAVDTNSNIYAVARSTWNL